MIPSTACQYGIRVMCRLAQRQPAAYVTLSKLCEGTEMPQPFVGKTLQVLVRGHLLRSKKGPHGGFALARQAANISLSEIVRVIDGPEPVDRCCLGLVSQACTRTCPLRKQWNVAMSVTEHALATVNLDALARAISEQ